MSKKIIHFSVYEAKNMVMSVGQKQGILLQAQVACNEEEIRVDFKQNCCLSSGEWCHENNPENGVSSVASLAPLWSASAVACATEEGRVPRLS